jgi:hypothetical protein
VKNENQKLKEEILDKVEDIASVIDKYYSNNHNKSKILVRGK